MHRINKSFSIAAAAITAFAVIGMYVLSAGIASAHVDPIGCSSNGVGLSLTVFRADGTTPVGGGSIGPGETVKYQATLSHLGGTNCNYEGGTLSIMTPDGASHVVASPATPVVPLVTGGSPFVSAQVTYVASSADVGGDNDFDSTADYSGGIAHTGEVHDTASAHVDVAKLFAKANPSIATQQSAGGPVGTELNDTASLSGGSSPTGSVTFKLFPPADATCAGAPVFTQVDAAAAYQTGPGYVSLVAGVYHWTADYAGDANNNATSSPCTAEPVTITKLTSETVTNIHNGAHGVVLSVPIGTGVHDNAHVTGSGPTPTGNVVFNLYSNQQCTGATTTTNGALSSGFAESGTTTVAAGGLGYIAYYQGDANYNPSIGICEPLDATKLDPLPVTEIHNAAHVNQGVSAPAGSTVHDKATVGGLVNSPIPTGTVDFTFYTGSLSCTGTSTASGTGVALNGSGIADPSSAQGPLAPGSYSFKAHYNGDAVYNPADAQCEPLTITKLTPTVNTTIHNAAEATVTSVNASTTVHDQANVTGSGATPTGNVDFTWYTNGSCTPAGVASGTGIVLDGGGIAHPSTSQTPVAPGNYSFRAHYNGDANYLPADGPCEPLEVKQVAVQGCSPGYWKQSQHFGSYPTNIGVYPNTSFQSVFGSSVFGSKSLLEVLSTGGGGQIALGRIMVGAYLNSFITGFPYTPAQVIAAFNGATPATYDSVKGTFEALQDPCPLGLNPGPAEAGGEITKPGKGPKK